MEKNLKKEMKQVAKKKAKKSTKKLMDKELNSLGLKSQPMRDKLSRHSAWYNSLMDPYHHPGAKVPDDSVVPSGTVQGITRFQIATNGVTSSLCAVAVGFGQLNSYTSSSGSAAFDYSVITNSSTATTSALGAWTFQNKAYSAQIRGLSQATRLVSAAMYATFQGSTLANQGRAISAFLPGSVFFNNNFIPFTTSAGVLATPYAFSRPLKDGIATVRYLPMDPSSFTYTQWGISALQPASGVFAPGGYGVLLFDGMTSSTAQVIEITIIENYEFIPLASTANLITTSASKSDPLELSAVVNEVASEPTLAVQPLSMAKVKDAQVQGGMGVTQDHPLQEKTFLEKILGGIDSALPTIGKVGKTVMDLAPLAAAFL